MRYKYRTAMTYLVLGIVLLQLAYMTFTGTQPVTLRNEQEEVTGIVDLTKLFVVISWCALITGICLLLMAIRSVLGTSAKEPSNSKASFVTKRLLGNSRVWLAFNILLIPLSVWTGYKGMVSPRVSETSPDFTLCVVILIMLPLFVIASVRFAEICRFRRPTWDRFPLNWLSDPLQALFISSWCLFGILLGSLFRLNQFGMSGIWAVAIYGSTFVGLLIGQAFVYWLHRDQIGDS